MGHVCIISHVCIWDKLTRGQKWLENTVKHYPCKVRQKSDAATVINITKPTKPFVHYLGALSRLFSTTFTQIS